LTTFLALSAGKLRKEVFVDPAEDILGAVLLVTRTDITNEVDKLAEALLVQAPGKIKNGTIS